MKLKPLIIGIVLMSLVFIAEIQTHLLIGTVAYIFIVLYILWLSRISQFLGVVGGIASFFIIAAFVFLFSEIQNNPGIIINRVLCVVVVWLAVYFTIRFRELYEEQQSKTIQLDALFENANEGILMADLNGKILLVNPFLESLFGYQKGELTHQHIQVLMPENSSQDYLQYIHEFVNNPVNRFVRQDIWARHKNGKVFPVEISLSYFYNRKQLVIIVFVLDAGEKQKHQQAMEANISYIQNYNLELEEKVKQRTFELEQANQALKKSQYLYKAMAHNFPDGIIGVLDKNMRYLLVDGKDLQQLGLQEKTIIGESIFDGIQPDLTTYAEEILRKVYSGESVSFDIELKGKFYNILSVPLNGSDQGISEILVVLKNVSSQKKLEKNLLKTIAKQKELNLLKSRFVTMASHEFRTPLTTILSSTFLLERYSGEQLEKEKNKHIGRIKQSIHGLIELLNDFLSLEKLDEGKVQIELSEINLQDFIVNLLQEVTLLKKENQQLKFIFEGEIKSVKADTKLLNTILINLLSNAIKYSQESGSIELHVVVNDKKIRIEVTDEGMGIPTAEQKHIFKRFFRAQNASAIEGTGLGLNIVKRYVKLLKGNIEFRSIENKGSTFTVQLPLLFKKNEPDKTLTL